MALLVAGTVGVIAVLGNGGRDAGGVLGQTFEPVDSAGDAAVVVPAGSATPLPLPMQTPAPTAPFPPTLTPSIQPIPTVQPTVGPVARASPRPTARPTPRPTPRPATQGGVGPARGPAETVDRFYRLIELHDYDAAAALWSPRMRGEYPPSRYIDGRFDATTRIDVHRLRIRRMSVASRDAVVSIDITEYRSSGSLRRWVGTWDLVLIGGSWRMDDPHLAAG
jgi:hypothetical protein